MQTIQILALGKCKESYLRDACREYEKRLSRFCQLQVTELEPVSLPQNPSEKEIAAALENLPDAETHVFTCTGATQVMDHVVHDYNMDQHGDITLDKAFRVSCNNAFAQAALMMGDTALRRTAESFASMV